MDPLQRWRDTCRTLDHINTDLNRIRSEVLPRARASIQSATECCERSNTLNIASTRRLLATSGESHSTMRPALVIASRP